MIECDASEHAAGYVSLIEDYADPSVKQAYAPVTFGYKEFHGVQMSLTLYAKEFLALHFAFEKFGHILWGATINKALTRIFRKKHIPSSLWKFVIRLCSFFSLSSRTRSW